MDGLAGVVNETSGRVKGRGKSTFGRGEPSTHHVFGNRPRKFWFAKASAAAKAMADKTEDRPVT